MKLSLEVWLCVFDNVHALFVLMCVWFIFWCGFPHLMHFTLMVSVWSCFTPWMLKLGNPHDVQLAGMWSGSVVPGFSSLRGMVVSFMGGMVWV